MTRNHPSPITRNHKKYIYNMNSITTIRNTSNINSITTTPTTWPILPPSPSLLLLHKTEHQLLSERHFRFTAPEFTRLDRKRGLLNVTVHGRLIYLFICTLRKVMIKGYNTAQLNFHHPSSSSSLPNYPSGV